MAIALVQQNYMIAVSSNTNVTNLGGTIVSGHLLVATIAWINNLTVTSVMDSAGNTWTQVPGAASGLSPGNYQSDIWYCKNCLAGAPFGTVTVTMSGTALRLRVWVTEWSGADTSAPVDLAHNLSTHAGPTSPAILPSVSGQLLVAVLASNVNTITAVSTGWTALGPGADSWETDYYINPAVSSQQAIYTPTSDEDFSSSIVSFLPLSSFFTHTASESMTLASSLISAQTFIRGADESLMLSSSSLFAFEELLQDTLTITENYFYIFNPLLFIAVSDSILLIDNLNGKLLDLVRNDTIILQDWLRIRRIRVQRWFN